MLGFGLVGCGLLGISAFDCMMLITLSRPWPAVLALTAGTVTTLIASLGWGHWVGFAYGAAGMVFGNLVAFLVAHRALQRVLRHADYYYFTSF